MSDISVGAVGAAAIAGLVSLLSLVIGKEQKVSEFRQTWIDDLRKCFVSFLVSINSISDSIRSKKAGAAFDEAAFASSYRTLNEAYHGIMLRVNAEEAVAQKLLKSLEEFELLANSNTSLTPDKIKAVEKEFVAAARELLKFEWKRVKRGEKTFFWTKWVTSIFIFLMISLLIYIWISGLGIINHSIIATPEAPLLNLVSEIL